MSDNDNNNNQKRMSMKEYQKKQYEQNKREMDELRERGRQIRERVNRKYQKKRDEDYLKNKVHNTRSKKVPKRKVRKLRKQYIPGTVDNTSSMKELRKALKQVIADKNYYDKQQHKADMLVNAKEEELEELRDEGNASAIREAEQRLEKRLKLAREMQQKVDEIAAEKTSIKRYINHLENQPALEMDRRRRRRRRKELEDLGMENSQFAEYMINMESDSASSDPDSEPYVKESSTSSSSSDSDSDFESPSEDEYDYDYNYGYDNNNNNSSSTTTTTSSRMPIKRKNAISEEVENQEMMKPPAPSPMQQVTKQRNDYVDLLEDLNEKKSALATYKDRSKRLRELLRETQDEFDIKLYNVEYDKLLTLIRNLEKEISDMTEKIKNLRQSNIKL